jgi:deoxyribonuclease-4
MHKIGAHLSVAGGYDKAIDSIIEKGGNCLQIFSSSPRQWKMANPSEESITIFNEKRKKLKVDPIYFHASYLLNLGYYSGGGEISRKVLINELNLASKMGVRGSIVHTGTFKKDDDVSVENRYNDLIINIKEILEQTPPNTFLILENSGTKKIGKDLAELATILDAVANDRVRICLDTCHLHVAGYDLKSADNFKKFLTTVDTTIGLDRIEVIHLNDSRDLFNSGRDRHENLGEGNVGTEVFRNLVNNPRTKNIPFIIETPGFEGEGPDKKNLDILKSFIEKKG